eukprot:scaffold57428_cov67-Phaeocystis_antarctica.AAC.1
MRHSGSSTPALAPNSLTLAGRATSGRRTQGGSVRCTAAGTSASQDATRSRATQQTLLILVSCRGAGNQVLACRPRVRCTAAGTSVPPARTVHSCRY